MNGFRYWVGRWQLAWRYCPSCNSSPPRRDCLVCLGSYDYGAHASGLGGPLADEDKAIWRRRWDALRRADREWRADLDAARRKVEGR